MSFIKCQSSRPVAAPVGRVPTSKTIWLISRPAVDRLFLVPGAKISLPFCRLFVRGTASFISRPLVRRGQR